MEERDLERTRQMLKDGMSIKLSASIWGFRRRSSNILFKHYFDKGVGKNSGY